MTYNRPVSVLILAAGKSSRMGFSKSLLRWNEQFNFTEKIIKEYLAAGVGDILLVCSDEVLKELLLKNPLLFADVTIVINNEPDLGRMHSIKLGAAKAMNGWLFIQDIDRPFIDEALLHSMILSIKPNCIIVPSYKGNDGHPILIPNEIKERILRANNNEKLSDCLKQYRKLKVENNSKAFLANLNTPESYKNWLKKDFIG